MLGEDRVEHRIGAGERGGVGAGGLGARLRSPRLGEEHGLAACPGRVERGEQDIPVLHAFRVRRHDRNLRASRHPLDAFGYRDVALVARGDPESDIDAAPAGEQSEMRPVRAALTHDGDRSGSRALDVDGGGERREVSDGGAVHAQAVGPQDAHAARARDLAHPALTRRADRIGLREAGREHHRRPYAAVGARLDCFEHSLGPNRHDGGVDRAGHIGDVRASLEALHPVASRIDRPDLALKPGLRQIAQRPAADSRGILGSTDDCD